MRCVTNGFDNPTTSSNEMCSWYAFDNDRHFLIVDGVAYGLTVPVGWLSFVLPRELCHNASTIWAEIANCPDGKIGLYVVKARNPGNGGNLFNYMLSLFPSLKASDQIGRHLEISDQSDCVKFKLMFGKV